MFHWGKEMDAKVFRMAILMIISAFVLVVVIVYATNVDKVSRLLGVGKDKSSQESTEDVSVEEQITGEFNATQIGDNLSGFEMDEDFFDPTERVPTVVVRKKNVEGADVAESPEGTLPEGEEPGGTGMAVVGQVINPNPDAAYYSTDGYIPDNPAFSTTGNLMSDDPFSATTGSTSTGDASQITSSTGASTVSSATTGTSTDAAGYYTTGNINPNASATSATTQESYGEYIPSSETITGTPVGIP